MEPVKMLKAPLNFTPLAITKEKRKMQERREQSVSTLLSSRYEGKEDLTGEETLYSMNSFIPANLLPFFGSITEIWILSLAGCHASEVYRTRESQMVAEVNAGNELVLQ